MLLSALEGPPLIKVFGGAGEQPPVAEEYLQLHTSSSTTTVKALKITRFIRNYTRIVRCASRRMHPTPPNSTNNTELEVYEVAMLELAMHLAVTHEHAVYIT